MDTLLSLSNDLAAAVERAAPAVVAVHARRRLPSTGIHWQPGIVVTAEHTVRTAEDITVTMADGRSRDGQEFGQGVENCLDQGRNREVQHGRLPKA